MSEKKIIHEKSENLAFSTKKVLITLKSVKL